MAGLAVIGLTLLFYWTPYAQVAVRSALAGGIVAGVGWVIAKVLYQEFAEQIFRYDKLWGSLSVVPLFLAWIHVSWLLVLSGARLSYAVEHSSFRDSLWAFGNHPRALELVATRVAMEATLAWVEGQQPPLPRELALRLRVSETFVHDAIERLVKAHLLELGRKGGVLPGRDPADISLAELAAAIHGVTILGGPETWTGPRGAPGFEQVEAIFHTADAATAEVLRRTKWIDLIAHLRPGLAAPEPPAPPATAARG
jgi:membrane protein